ncbi:uncharacterized protein [Hetaerina americana]|uniref:uncharacterized protein n=1 Tax=Hetaerina americana TaxID=62018 RepID=UPI003A7F595A
MGNFLSRHAAYTTKEDESYQTPEPKYEERAHRILSFDPRSPTAEIVRTPIQIIATEKQDDLGTPASSPSTKPSELDTPVSIYSTKAMRSSEVDLPSLNDLTATEDTCIDAFDNMLESIEAELIEIERSYNPAVSTSTKLNKEKVKEVRKISQKLEFSPEIRSASKTLPKKARTPLGIRSSNAPADVMSPSTFLRLKQQRSVYDNAFQKFPLSQQSAFNCENTPPHAVAKAATLPRKRASVEWDKDATMII